MLKLQAVLISLCHLAKFQMNYKDWLSSKGRGTK